MLNVNRRMNRWEIVKLNQWYKTGYLKSDDVATGTLDDLKCFYKVFEILTDSKSSGIRSRIVTDLKGVIPESNTEEYFVVLIFLLSLCTVEFISLKKCTVEKITCSYFENCVIC